MQQVSKIAKDTPGVDQVVTIAGVSALDNNSPLANAGVAYIILKDWSLRGKGEDLASLYATLNNRLSDMEDGRVMVLPPPPIQGIGNAAGFTLQIEVRDGSFDLAKLQNSVQAVASTAADTVGHTARLGAISRQRSAIYRRDRPREVAGAWAQHGPGFPDACRLYGLDICQPVQQVRTCLPGLCAGRLAVPGDAGGHQTASMCAIRTAT